MMCPRRRGVGHELRRTTMGAFSFPVQYLMFCLSLSLILLFLYRMLATALLVCHFCPLRRNVD